QPALEPIGAALFLLGLLRALWTMRRGSALAAVLLLWLVCGTAPTVFSKTDSPNFLRTLILTPCVAALAGWGADGMARSVGRRFGHWIGNALAGILVASSVTVMMALYFLVWARMPELWRDFSGQADQIARYALRAGEGERVFVPAAIAKESYTYRFLASDARRASVFSPEAAFGRDPEPGVDHLIVESDSIDARTRLAIARYFPKVELAAEFPMEGFGEEGRGWIWARAWRVRAAELLGPEAAKKAGEGWE
ncbi:MAG: hypothetical protein NTW86_01230, partial [Candidatus Sumerlaeota bacterium]|nr:hypothetical protein [Candidatus Sumerlaeota bacterium]